LDSQHQDAATTEGGRAESVEESPEQQQKLPTREPLAKNFFIGVVDKELLAYPIEPSMEVVRPGRPAVVR